MSRLLWTTAAAALGLQAPALGQFTPAGTGGVAAIDYTLRQLGHHKRILLVAAHPDDEDTELLTVLARGHGAQAAYLALTRGEGGQNGIGPELGIGLGLVRAGELLAAREIDGARQYFTRAYDFGYSKSVDETFRLWSRDSLLKDLVRVIRRFRPQIVVTTFVGAPREGHGQHRVAGLLAVEAFAVAGDATRFPELATEEGLAPHAPDKLFRSARFDTTGTSVRFDGGALDPVAGKSYHQIARAGRSMHRSQDFGSSQPLGPSVVRLALLEDRTGSGGEQLFAGIDTTLAGLVRNGERSALQRTARDAHAARATLNPAQPDRIVPLIRSVVAGLRAAREEARGPDETLVLGEQLALARETLRMASGLVVDAVADREQLVPGGSVRVDVTVWNAGDSAVRVRRVEVSGRRPGWQSEPDVRVADLGHGALARSRFVLHVPSDAPATVPYFLERPLAGAIYDWSGASPRLKGMPFGPGELTARIELEITGERFTVEREIVHAFADQAVGEVRRPIHVVPRVGVTLDPATVVWPAASRDPRVFTVTLTSADTALVRGVLTLELPDGWPSVESRPFALARPGEREAYQFEVRLPANLPGGSFRIQAAARTDDGVVHRTAVVPVTYPHVRPRFLLDSAVAAVEVAALALPVARRIGYVRGASDRVPEALLAVGFPIELLDDEALRRADLHGFDVVVIGARAYETNPVLVETNARLLEYVERGGLVVVQYQQYQFVRGGFAPLPLTITRPHDRVTDETATPVLLEPDHPVFNVPNVIGDGDWMGWVQERGLYFPRSWDPGFVPLIAFADPGEEPKAGGLLVARVGNGTYVYTGLSFFRQLPAAVPGAFRLFANLLALGDAVAGQAGGR